MTKIIVIIGPTAVGKTELSLKLAQKFNGEIISGDSMQVYRHLNIGTAKIMPNEQAGIIHHLIDIKNVDERYSAADFVTDASIAIETIVAKGKIPIIVGGTGFYIQALLNGLTLGGDGNYNPVLRKELQQLQQDKGLDALVQRLNQIDPLAIEKIDLTNAVRVIRAIEVKTQTGNSITQQTNQTTDLDAFIIGLNTNRTLLYERINQRVDLMMKQGLIDEAKWLLDNGGFELPASKGIGYREFNHYEFNHDATVLNLISNQIKQDSRHYAKRQLTWFRNKTAVNQWYDLVQQPEELTAIFNDVSQWLKNN
ncbi:tRNA (adenosine(37)-N6)-dimethylallyltransferase MiaA [Lentilactobacillus kribbianus]|uniref:tRNA (adenosine(37)-N6)-dimethylallyltransferase MiaA n=1 Tax=Lentilactobacillus kribbianus TaxID=2729622 RepID=UPI001554BDFE|nr:tRNA (adenosine(37)-N6)-dimethylallyltransferase MiaA [Lentilactobacillus kribbianus]